MRIAWFFVLILWCTNLNGQDRVPPALAERLLAFTDQLWLSWMQTGDIRSLDTARLPKMSGFPPCSAMPFTTENVCQELSKEERVNYLRTTDNIMGLLFYRFFSHDVLDKEKIEHLGPDVMFAVLSVPELSLMTKLIGQTTTVDEFRGRIPEYEQLEKMLQSAHVKNFEQTKEIYVKNLAKLDEILDSPKVSEVDSSVISTYGLPTGEYFTVRKGASLFWLSMVKNELKFVVVQPLTE